jgi:polyisoprenyl-phosphate glycosyltransferase
MNKKFKLSVVVPVYNEAEGIAEFNKRLVLVLEKAKYNYEVIYVNDGSKDDSPLQIATFSKENKNIKLVNFSKNFGHQLAVSAGLDYVKGDAVVIIDADLQDPPEVINQLIEKWQEGYQIVNARRKTRKDTFLKILTAKLFYRLLNLLLEGDIPENVGDFRLLDRTPVEVLKTLKEKDRYLRGLTNWIGFRQTFVDYDRDARYAGETHYPLRKMVRLGLNAIYSFSNLPLKIASFVATVFMLVAIVVTVYVIGSVMQGEVVPGWASEMLIITISSSIQFFVLGILSEYIRRINVQVQDRPLYIVSDTINIKKSK